jgi:hypothetical protein
MGRHGEWHRWGRGSCEGWSLEIGSAFRGSVVKRQIVDEPPTWDASVNTAALGRYLDRDDAMKRVESSIEGDMRLVLDDWAHYLDTKTRK